MTLTIGTLLALSFLISVLGLFIFIWAQINGLMRAGPASEVIFAKGEVGLVEDSSLSQITRAALQHVESESSGRTDDDAEQRTAISAEFEARVEQDRSSRAAAFGFLASLIFWLLLGGGIDRFREIEGGGHLEGAARDFVALEFHAA